MKSKLKSKRIGIYAGTFDPVHSGHITFALQAIQQARLDKLYFLPERRPRHKKGVEHFAHRVAMLRQAVQPHPKFGVLEPEDISFSVARTLPRLRTRFRGDQLAFLFGSDAAVHLPEWPQAERLLQQAEVIIGCRKGDDMLKLEKLTADWPRCTVIQSYAPEVSSSRIRLALALRQPIRGLLKSVERYSERHWLYVSLSRTAGSIDKP